MGLPTNTNACRVYLGSIASGPAQSDYCLACLKEEAGGECCLGCGCSCLGVARLVRGKQMYAGVGLPPELRDFGGTFSKLA
jgi:hypothetical protein